jgi:hypothetical protein
MRRRVLAVLALAVMNGCSHTYIYGDRVAPTIANGELIVPTRSGDVSYSIRRIGVTGVDDPFSVRAPSAEELASMRAGVVPDGVGSLRIEVDNAGELWSDWGLAGFGIGATLVMAGVGLSGAFEPGSSDTALTVPLTILFASLVGTEFMLIGVGLGVGFDGGNTDMRYRDFADE